MKHTKTIVLILITVFLCSAMPKAKSIFRPFFIDQESQQVTMYFNPSTISRIEILGEEEGEKGRMFDVFRVHFTDAKHIDVTEDINEFIKRCN